MTSCTMVPPTESLVASLPSQLSILLSIIEETIDGKREYDETMAQKRIETVERLLLDASEHLLPSNPDELTAVELVKLLQKHYEMQVAVTPRHWTMGRPLETLLEADQETEASTPAESKPTLCVLEDDDDDDDSALYSATLVAASTDRAHPTPPQQPVVAPQRVQLPRHIHFEPVSPANTNITLDTHFLNETMQALDAVYEDHCSVDSDETPVLDRYRIEHNDESPHGFRVVPNQRRNKTSKTTVYRKTPYKYSKMLPMTPTIDENAPLETDVVTSLGNTDVPANHGVPAALESTSPSLVTTPNHKLLDKLTDYENTLNRKRFHSLEPSLLYAQAQLALRNSASPAESLLVSPPPASRQHPASCIRPISQEEYNDAPRVVSMQVTFEEALAACNALNDAILDSRMNVQHQELKEEQAKRILAPLGFTERKSKTVLMSLCHWRRLIMRRHSMMGDAPAEQNLTFEVVV